MSATANQNNTQQLRRGIHAPYVVTPAPIAGRVTTLVFGLGVGYAH
jgi:hypothetical protein